MKTVVFVSESCEGGSFFECILEVPDGLDLETQRKIWGKWYNEEYCADFNPTKKVIYYSLLDQLLANGCRPVDMEVWSY